MSYTPIRGFDGTVSQGATAVALASVLDWEADVDVDIQKDGPFLNDSGKVYKVVGGTDCKGKVKGKVGDGGDASVAAIFGAVGTAAGLNLELSQGISSAGYTLTVPGALISNFKLGQDAKNGATFEFAFEANGSFTLA